MFDKLTVEPTKKIRVFCLPYAGGSAISYRNWRIPHFPRIEIYPLSLPGRAERATDPRRIDLLPLVQTLGTTLLPFMDTPFAFFGHSMGALISFELTRWLRKHNYTLPKHLFVSSHRAPQAPNCNPNTYNLPEIEFIQQLKKLNGTPVEVLQNHELMQLLIPILRADFFVCETYVHKKEEPIDCPITVLGGTSDSIVKIEHLEAWKELTNSTFELFMFKGDHFYIHERYMDILEIINSKV